MKEFYSREMKFPKKVDSHIKNIVVLIVFLILIVVLFSGCNSNIRKDNNDEEEIKSEEKVEILNYTVTTQWSTGCTCDSTYELHVEPGFYHIAYIGYGAFYNIDGEVLNNAGEKIEKVIISARFYNENGTELFNTDQLNDSITIYNLSEGESKNFTMQVLPWQYSNYIGIILSEEAYKIFYSTESLEFYFT